jgi:tryptophanyl-tRNA synthetase
VSNVFSKSKRVLSGMRSSGRLHLGHYHGVLKNWVKLQHEYECFFFVADWHGLTTHYESPHVIGENLWDMVVDWLAAGVNHGLARLFIQSWVPEHAELHLLLSMMTPLGWLERVPTYKDQQESLRERDLSTYGFLGYPLLQSADILAYHADYVPVGEDQVAHVELTREVARRFNYLYGRERGFEQKAEEAIKKMGKKNAKLYNSLKKAFQQEGDTEALETAKALLNSQQNISLGDRERLMGYLEGGGKMVLVEPEALLTEVPKFPGLDGRKMSKSYGNTIALREAPDVVEKKILTMPTDPNRIKRSDPGEPSKCPVWPLHQVYSDKDAQGWVVEGCTTAAIGCVDCKKRLSDSINDELRPIQESIKEYQEDPSMVKSIIAEGSEAARVEARATLEKVKKSMGLDY